MKGSRVENRILLRESLVHQQRVSEQQAVMDDLQDKLSSASAQLETINNTQGELGHLQERIDILTYYS